MFEYNHSLKGLAKAQCFIVSFDIRKLFSFWKYTLWSSSNIYFNFHYIEA
jgi:hypothetical protein